MFYNIFLIYKYRWKIGEFIVLLYYIQLIDNIHLGGGGGGGGTTLIFGGGGGGTGV